MAMVVPIRSFTGMTRLAGRLGEDQRERLAISLAERVLTAGDDAGLEVRVVTSDAAVALWAEGRSKVVVDDPGEGLDAAASAGVASVPEGRWMVVHADLPLVNATALAAVTAAGASYPLLVPSTDGGTTVVAASGRFRFAYGRGSFHRHLARYPSATLWTDPSLMIDLDTADDFDAIEGIGYLPSLNR